MNANGGTEAVSCADQPLGWLDIHGHFYPPASEETRKQKHQAMIDGKFIVPESATLWSSSDTISYLDSAGVQMQMLSNIPQSVGELRASNDFGARMVKEHPSRFGLLAALPIDEPLACLEEIERATTQLNADGFAVTCCYKGVWLSDERLDPVWAELNRRKAVVFTHPNAYAPAHLGRPSPLIEVAFETARAVVDMVYHKVFLRYPDITFVISHCGGALPALSGRIKLLGTQPWVPNEHSVTVEDITKMLAGLYVDTAATGSAETVAPAVTMTGAKHLVYGSDCGVPCSTTVRIPCSEISIMSLLTPCIENNGKEPRKPEE